MPLPFQRRPGAQFRPSFSRDFAGLKTLDHGVGPAITFTRASGATFFDASGVLQTASNDAPRFDHDPATAGNPSRGLLIEEARTNSIRNSQAGGSTNGVIGSGGAVPTNWTLGGSWASHGLTSEIIGTGTEDGLSYIDIKVSGTPTATADVGFNSEQVFQVVASNGQTWTHSAYLRVVGGSTSNVTIRPYLAGRPAAGSPIVSGQTAETTATVTSAALKSQRYSATITFSSASVERVSPQVLVGYTNANPIDLTLRIAAPQLEQGAFPTSYIPTTTAAATRSADSAVVTPISSFYNQAEGTLFAEASFNAPNNHTTSQLAAEFNATDNNRFRIGRLQPNAFPLLTNTVATVTDANIAGSSAIVQFLPVKIVGAYKVNDFALYANGSSSGTDESATPISATHFRVGSGTTSNTFIANGHIRKIAYWPKRLSNTLLQQLTT